MKKIGIVVLVLICLLGCEKLENSPTKQVEAKLSDYQTLNEKVLDDLKISIEKSGNFTDDQKEIYTDIMKRHYQNLRYEIKEETVDGDEAIVTVEIEVTDYSKVLTDAENYRQSNEKEFMDDKGNYSQALYNSYKLNAMKSANEKVKYTIDFTLTKDDKKDRWMVNNLTTADEQKLNGTYNH